MPAGVTTGSGTLDMCIPPTRKVSVSPGTHPGPEVTRTVVAGGPDFGEMFTKAGRSIFTVSVALDVAPVAPQVQMEEVPAKTANVPRAKRDTRGARVHHRPRTGVLARPIAQVRPIDEARKPAARGAGSYQ